MPKEAALLYKLTAAAQLFVCPFFRFYRTFQTASENDVRVQVAAENAEADFELAAKQAGAENQDPTVKPGYGQSDGGAVPEPESDSLLVVATAVDTATEIEADILPSKPH